MNKTSATLKLKKATPKAPRGRPADPRKDEVIQAVASRLFMRHGVQGTTMDQIAKEAGVSKLTLYRKYPDKNALFIAVVGCKCESYMPESLFDVGKAISPETALNRIGVALLELCTHDEGVNLHRVLTAEAGHNPGLGEQFFTSGPRKVKACLHGMMAAFSTQKRLKIDNVDDASDFFCALILGSEMVKHANMGIGPKITPQAIKTYVQRAVAFFLRAYS